jgi:aspartate/methionine/tyrosine aminotransferase
MQFRRMPIEAESPEEMGYGNIGFNLAESSVRDISLQRIGLSTEDFLLSYGPHRGDDALRTAILDAQKGLEMKDVLVTPGAAGALFFIATTLLRKEDHLIVIRPNYATNLETPRAIGCQITFVDLSFEEGFAIDIDKVKAAIQANTRLISITTPHNPTGVIYAEEDILLLSALAEKSGAKLLVDETYRDLLESGQVLDYAARLHPNIISVASLSKAFGVPGIRTGWIICRDSALMEQLLAAKEQIIICGSILDEKVACKVLEQKDVLLKENLSLAWKNKRHLEQWITGHEMFEWVSPAGGVVAFPRLKEDFQHVKEHLYDHLFNEYGTIVGPGHWFEQDKRYMRIGFGFPLEDEFQQGLINIENAVKDLL